MKTHSHTQKLSHSSDTQFDRSFAFASLFTNIDVGYRLAIEKKRYETVKRVTFSPCWS